MLITHVTTELAPFAKVGGLGDVVYGLSKELVKQGQQVQILLPKYQYLSLGLFQNPHIFLKKNYSLKDSSSFEVFFWKASFENLSLVFIDPQPPEDRFYRQRIYGEQDDIDRFLLFSFLSADYLYMRRTPFSVVHLHDWPTSMVATFLKTFHPQHTIAHYKIILTLHNIMHQGRCHPYHLHRLSLPQLPFLQDPQDPQLINLLQGGIVSADHLTTVSPTYAKEIQSSPLGYHLDATLRNHHTKLSGILNGIDLTYWNPEQDPALAKKFPGRFSAQTVLEIKENNKKALCQQLQMEYTPKRPLFGCITRLDEQKGPFLIAHGISTILRHQGQCIVIGQAMSPSVEQLFNHLQSQLPSHSFHFHHHFNDKLARLLYAAADFILIPSLFEPCGLTQMIAMRYYSIPIARKTGGLADTVHDVEDPAIPPQDRVGITFHDMTTEAFDAALLRGFKLYNNLPIRQDVLKTISLKDFSWQSSATQYLHIYSS